MPSWFAVTCSHVCMVYTYSFTIITVFFCRTLETWNISLSMSFVLMRASCKIMRKEGRRKKWQNLKISINPFSLFRLIRSYRQFTVPCRLNRLSGHLWYDLRVFWVSEKCFKNAPKRFFSIYPNKCSLDLSKEIL